MYFFCLLEFGKVVRLDLSMGSKVDAKVDMVAVEEEQELEPMVKSAASKVYMVN